MVNLLYPPPIKLKQNGSVFKLRVMEGWRLRYGKEEPILPAVTIRRDNPESSGRLMRILGIDPGIGVTGYGMVEKMATDGWRLRVFGEIPTNVSDPFPTRLKSIFDGLRDVMDRHLPTEVVLESTFLANNVQSALKLGQARGVALLAAAMVPLPIFEYGPTAVKMAVVGYGRATKHQVQQMVSRLLSHTPVITAEHAADALAIALCHAHSANFRTRLQATLPSVSSNRQRSKSE